MSSAREQAREAVRHADGKRGDPFGDFRADAASDAWVALAKQRERCDYCGHGKESHEDRRCNVCGDFCVYRPVYALRPEDIDE